MAAKLLLLAAASLAHMQLAVAAPVEENVSAATRLNTAVMIDDFNQRWTLAVQAECSGQSCVIADAAGTTGNLPRFKAEGGDAQSYKCIAKYNPEGAKAAQAAPPVTKQSTGLSSVLLGSAYKTGQLVPGFGPPDTGKFTARCSPNILIFAKGTLEIGELGITVGPVLNTALAGRQWTVVGVPYAAEIAGDYCLGMPGGWMAKDMINQAAEKCPTSKIFVSGYSQGAMVAHIGVAYAKEEHKSRIKVSSKRKKPQKSSNWKKALC
jgi:hypothetical protein